MAELEKASTIFDLSLDIKYVVLDNLDNRSLAYLAQTCKYFGKQETKLQGLKHKIIEQLQTYEHTTNRYACTQYNIFSKGRSEHNRSCHAKNATFS